MQELKLFYKEECPYCQIVLRYLKKYDIDGVEMVDIKADSKNQEDVVKLGGKDQVPMLLIDGKPLYESSDIVKWFKENK